MKIFNGKLDNFTLVLSLLSVVFLLFILYAIPSNKTQIFTEKDILSVSELLIIIGFVSILVFDLVSLNWLAKRIRTSKQAATGDIAALILCLICLFMFIGEKVMLDEIGRETALGWETFGEWIILYTFLFTQLVYNSIIITKLFRSIGLDILLKINYNTKTK